MNNDEWEDVRIEDILGEVEEKRTIDNIIRVPIPPETIKEQKWHKFYLDMAEKYSQLSKDPRTKVGAIIVSSNFEKILSVGFNGWAKGEPDIPDSLEPGKSGSVHAETNALIKIDHKYLGSYMYLTHNPCRQCSRMIVNAGFISKVFFKTAYRDTSGIDILKKYGRIQVYRLDEKGNIVNV